MVRYIKGTPGQGILLSSANDFQINGWCDSDYSGCPITRRSVTDYFVQLGESPMSWKTKKQSIVSKSLAEAEYRAMSLLRDELLWIKNVLQTLGISHVQPMRINCDSKAAIYISTNPVFHERTKHIENDCHTVRDEIQSRNMSTHHVPSAHQLAYIFTKPLGRQAYESFRSKLGILDLHAPT